MWLRVGYAMLGQVVAAAGAAGIGIGARRLGYDTGIEMLLVMVVAATGAELGLLVFLTAKAVSANSNGRFEEAAGWWTGLTILVLSLTLAALIALRDHL
jgi:hypothetical protein